MCPSPQEKIQVESCSKGEFTNEKVDALDGRTITQFEESSQDFVVISFWLGRLALLKELL